MAFDDPRVMALLGAGAGFLDPQGGLSAGFRNGMMGMQVGNQMQQQKASAAIAQRKLTKQMEIEDTLRSLADKHGADTVGFARALSGSQYPELIKLGIDMAKAKSVKSFIKGKDAEGNPTYYAGYNTGELSPTGVTPADRLMQINRGNQIDLSDPYSGVAQKSIGVGMSPGQSAQLAQSDRHFGASHALAQQNSALQQYKATRPEFKDGAFVYPPSSSNPQGSMVKTELFSAPKGSDAEKAKLSTRIKTTLGDDTEDLIKQATGSMVGSAVDAMGSVVGVTTAGAKANAALKLRASTLAGNMPRFEGPQSDADRKYYLEMAGDLGNPSKTTEEKLVALKELRRLHNLGGSANSDGWGDLK